MNQIVHETVNNTVFDVETQMNFEEVKNIFENKDIYKLALISKNISEFNFDRNKWLSLIKMINPFDPNIVMVESQKGSFPFFNFVILNAKKEDIVFSCNNPIDDYSNTLINMIGVINNGYKLFTYIDKNINKINEPICWFNSVDSINPIGNNNAILDTARYGNIQNYLFLENKASIDDIFKISTFNKDIFSMICHNPDMRLMKHFLNKYHDSFNFNDNYKNYYFKGIFGSHIPFKYQMRRLKLLNKYYSLEKYYPIMIDNNYLNYKTMRTISKFYYKSPIYNNINNINNHYSQNSIFTTLRDNISGYYQDEGSNGSEVIKYFYTLFTSININDLKELIKKFYELQLLDTPVIKELISEINSRGDKDVFSINKLLSILEIRRRITNYIKLIACSNNNNDNTEFNVNSCWNSLSYFLQNNIFYDSKAASDFIKESLRNVLSSNSPHSDRYLSYLIILIKVPFKIPTSISNTFFKSILKGIRIRSLLKRTLFRKVNNARKQQKINFQIVLNNIVTFKPNHNIPVLSEGSCMYRINKQKLEKHKYPIHIDPCQMIWLGEKDCFLREKADGIYTDSISFQHYPKVSMFNTSVIKSEYLEDDNLHLVFDIDLNDNIQERYKYLRQSHPYTRDSSEIVIITNINDFIINIREERLRFLKFKTYVEENDIIDPIWYPKAAWLIKANNSVISDLTKIVTNLSDSSNYEFLINQSEFPIDGFIVQPLDGSTEAKIKPNDQMTVDLLFDGSKWLTREKTQINNMNCKDIRLSKNIWRCYWVEGNWIPREIRWDKKIPNPNYIVDYLTNYNINKWKVDDVINFKKSYYIKNKSIIRFNLIKIFKEHRAIQYSMFEKENCIRNSKWLDIGCGKGNSIDNINNFSPSEYIGFDNDPYCVWEAKMRHSNDFHNFTLYDFSRYNDLSSLISTKKIYNVFDYLVCNFVIQYAAISREIWDKWLVNINLRSKKGSIIFINFMDLELLTKHIENNIFNIDDKSFIELSNDNELNYDIVKKWARINFDWVHQSPIYEPVLDSHTLKSEFEKNGWKLTNEFNSNNTNSNYQKFSSIYKWLTFVKE